ncbi:hypothetical protein Cgig2_003294 [Carnegiea gigantea]|uniref:MLO-like protein n=1 Tax=Carnegiea gigantea TaxID=171969 RepID=A0A9Q1JQ36_9CARY|nr:hypothetical protein Cgig2_003294 [Carnegiea gigantea]
MEEVIREGRSLAETPTWSVATVTSLMVFICFLVQRCIYWFGKWLKKTRRKALLASLEKIKEELMLLGLISLMLGQWARWISEICVDSSLFNRRFYLCSEEDFSAHEHFVFTESVPSSNEPAILPRGLYNPVSHQCPQGREPFVSYEGLEQLHRFLFVLGITHVLYSFVAVGLAMIKIYSWRKWENQAISQAGDGDVPVVHFGLMPLYASYSMFTCQQYKGCLHVISQYFLHEHDCLKLYYLCSHPKLVMVVGTKLEHVVSLLALEIAEPRGSSSSTQVKPRDELFWFGKPEMILRLIQFISFQWGFKQRSCFMKDHAMVIIRLVCGYVFPIENENLHRVLVQFWCSYSTVPLSVIITQMGSKCKKALVAESVRESLHSWCKRVKRKSKLSHAARSVCSLDERDETTTVASLTLSPSSSVASLNEVQVVITELPEKKVEIGDPVIDPSELSFRLSDYISQSAQNTFPEESSAHEPRGIEDEEKIETLFDLFKKT